MSIYLSKKKVNPQVFPSFCGISVKDFITKRGCDSLFANCNAETISSIISYDDTASVTTMVRMFDSSKLQTIPLLNTSNVTNMNYMFNMCAKLKSVPLLDTSNVEIISGMFALCLSLTEIPAFNVYNVRRAERTFSGCRSITQIHMVGMGCSFDISSCTKMEREALLEVLNNLATAKTSTTTLTLGKKLLAKLTEEDKAIAINKGWKLK